LVASLKLIILIKALVLELISPLKLSFILLLLSLIARSTGKYTKVAHRLVMIALIWLLIWSQPYSADLLLYPLERNITATNNPVEEVKNPDYIVVLACYYNTEGVIPEISRWSHCSLQRLVQAALLQTKLNTKILLTGGYFLEDEKTNYSLKAEEFLISLGVSPKSIISTSKGTTTQEEIASIKDKIYQKKVLVVTTATHVRRVSNEFEGITRELFFFPVDYHSNGNLTPYLTLPSLAALDASRSAFYEYLALIKQRFS